MISSANEKYREATPNLPTIEKDPAAATLVSTNDACDEPHVAFIRRFSTINLTSNQLVMRPDRAWKLERMVGNSRDDP